jgi:hypothetical protein
VVGTWLFALGSLATGAEVVVAPGTGGALREAPASCGSGPLLYVDRGDPRPGDDALMRVRAGATEVVVPTLGPWRDASLVCAGDAPWLWMWRDDAQGEGEGVVTGLFPVVQGALGAGVTLDGRWVDPRPSPSGDRIVVREDGGEGAQTLVELGTRRSRPLGYGGTVSDGAWLPGSDVLVVVVDGESGPELTVWDPDSRDPARHLAVGGKRPRPGTLALSPDGSRAAFTVGGDDAGLRIVDLDSGDVVRVPGPSARPVWSPSSRAVAAVGTHDGERELVVWRSNAHEQVVARYTVPHSALGAFTEGEDALRATWLGGGRLVLGSRWGTAPLRVLERGRLRELRVPDLALDTAARTADGDLWTVDGGELWRIRSTGRAVRVPVPVDAASVAVRPNDTVVVVARSGEVVRLGPTRRDAAGPAPHR